MTSGGQAGRGAQVGPKAGRLSLVPATVAVWKKCGNTWGNGDKRMPKSQVLGRCVTLFREQREGHCGEWVVSGPEPSPCHSRAHRARLPWENVLTLPGLLSPPRWVSQALCGGDGGQGWNPGSSRHSSVPGHSTIYFISLSSSFYKMAHYLGLQWSVDKVHTVWWLLCVCVQR